MYRLRTSPLARVLALVAGIAVAVAPLVSQAECGCDACDCATAATAENQSVCCCLAEQQACCPTQGVAANHCSFGASITGCCCEVSQPQQPVQQRSEQTSVQRDAAALLVATIPTWPMVAELGFAVEIADGTFHSPSPSARVLYCVWRN